MFKNMEKYVDSYLHIIKEDVNQPIENQDAASAENQTTQTTATDQSGQTAAPEQTAQVQNQDATQKDRFLSIVYDLIDKVYDLGYTAGMNKAEKQNPQQDEEVDDILGSLEAAYDDGRPVQE